MINLLRSEEKAEGLGQLSTLSIMQFIKKELGSLHGFSSGVFVWVRVRGLSF